MILSTNELINKFRQRTIEASDAFDVLKTIAQLVNREQLEHDPLTQELVLRALDQRHVFGEFDQILNSIARQVGLFPYLSRESLNVKDALAIEFHRPSNISHDDIQDGSAAPDGEDVDDSIVFHRAQANVFRRLVDGQNVILSAPTSFGKSSIVDALIATGKYDNVVIIVPTIALIDEIRRRMARFRPSHKIVTHASQSLLRRNIFVLTQERVVDFPAFPNIDLLVLDEFYKLDSQVGDERSVTLNHAFYKLLKRSNQFYLLGPNVERIPEGFPERFDCQFIRTDYATVVTEVENIDLRGLSDESRLVELCSDLSEPTLIYCSSPDRANKITKLLMNAEAINAGSGMSDAAAWIGKNYHADWTYGLALAHGIGVHHGRLPRALAHLSVRGFNEGRLRFLICTSTLIEGVNTKAKNIIIYDNKIARRKLDYFTFNNIRGRSGRMFQYFIGRVYLFSAEPSEKATSVDVPMYTQSEANTSESLLVQMDDSDLSPDSRRRVERYRAQAVLGIDVIRQNAGVEPSAQLALASALRADNSLLITLAWTGLPTWAALLALCEVIWRFFIPVKSLTNAVASGRQLAYRINQLRTLSMFQLIEREAAGKNSDFIDAAVESSLDFIKNWAQYKFGRFAMTICRIQGAIALELSLPVGDYTFFVSQVENLFSDRSLIALDEYGVPFPLAKKLESQIASDSWLDGALENLKALDLNSSSLSRFEREVLEDARSSI